MRTAPLVLAFLLAMSAQAQPIEGARSTLKRVYNLVPPSEPDDRPVGALRRSEVETYGLDGRRLRVEWRGPDGAVQLAFMELYDHTGRSVGAVYFEGGELDPNLERNEYTPGAAPGTTVKRVTYFGADGVTTSINEFVLDADGRELVRRYGDAEGTVRGSDTIDYDGVNQTGYVTESADGSRRSEYVYRVETVDEHGNWTSRTVERDGEPRLFETREIEYISE
ncbi:hypothetical protein [Rubrivirga sp.]|uniref:hypothetical protein n=1 Tax=Rubrivirga sp. TaxID=1885344 RepID=UPI003C72DA74